MALLRCAPRSRETELCGRLRPRPGDAFLVGEHDDLDPVAQAELGEDPCDVALHRRLAEVELARDLGVRQAARDEPEDVELALAERSSGRRRTPGRRRRRQKSSISRRVIAGASSDSPPATVADGGGELLARRVLEQEARSRRPSSRR